MSVRMIAVPNCRRCHRITVVTMIGWTNLLLVCHAEHWFWECYIIQFELKNAAIRWRGKCYALPDLSLYITYGYVKISSGMWQSRLRCCVEFMLSWEGCLQLWDLG